MSHFPKDETDAIRRICSSNILSKILLLPHMSKK